MKTTGSLSLNSQLFDPIRKEYVAATPEEEVRQALLHHMVHDLGYPQELLAVEKSLSSLPHVPKDHPNRRIDILCFGKGVHPDHDLYPLLMIECKAVKLNDGVIRQVTGYNHYVGAPFIAVANKGELRLGWKEKGEYRFRSTLPSYEQLCDTLRLS